MNQFKTYLGDGAFVSYDGFGLELTAENWLAVTDRIYLEPEVWATLKRFVDGLKAAPRDAGNR